MHHQFLAVASSPKLNQSSPTVALPLESTAATKDQASTHLIGLLPLIFVLTWAIAVLWSSKGKSSRDTHRLRQSSKIPCKSCQFFKDNPYLKCAIHPSTAATPLALACSDYSPQANCVSVKSSDDRPW